MKSTPVCMPHHSGGDNVTKRRHRITCRNSFRDIFLHDPFAHYLKHTLRFQVLPKNTRGKKKKFGFRAFCNSSPKFWNHHDHHHQSLKREGRWGTTDDFATSFLHFSLFSTALWDLPNSRPVHSLVLSFHLFLCLSCLLPPFTVPCKMVLARPDERET